MPTVYLVSGANRGIGLGLVTAILSENDDSIVFAGIRSIVPDTTANDALNALTAAYPKRVHIISLVSADEENNKAAVEEIKAIAGRLDVVIANAGIGNSYAKTLDMPLPILREHWDINVGGPLVLFQSTFPLMRASTNAPKFVVISSVSGSTTLVTADMPLASGGTKAAVNYLVRKMHVEHESDGLVSFPICPGPVETDLFANAKTHAPWLHTLQTLSIDEVSTKLLSIIDNATREEHGGKFLHLGGVYPW